VKKGEDIVVTVIDTVYAQATEIPEVIVFVNQFDKPLSTMTEGMLETPPSVWTASATTLFSLSSSSPTTPAAAPATDAAQIVSSSSSTPVAYTVTVPASSSPSAVTSSAAPAQTSTPSSSSPPESTGFGFSYSPYNADGSCKTQDQVNTDFDSIGNGYSLVRTYGTDCNQVATVLSAARSKGLKMFAGIYYLSTLSSEIETIVTAASGDWTSFDTISIGNELVNSGTASAAIVVAAISTARGLLTTAGYTGKVVTVDTLVAARANPSLCETRLLLLAPSKVHSLRIKQL
jgi:hypothetical protein